MAYRQSDITMLSGKRRLHTAISTAIALATVVACVIMCVFTNHGNKTAMTIGAAAIAIVGGWAVIADVYLAVLPNKYRARRIAMLLRHEPRSVSGTVSEITRLTVDKWVSAHEIKLINADDGKTYAYLLDDKLFPSLDFDIGDSVTATVYDKYVSEIEARRE